MNSKTNCNIWFGYLEVSIHCFMRGGAWGWGVLHGLNFTVWHPDPATFASQSDSGASFHLWH